MSEGPESNALLEVISGFNERDVERALRAVAEDCEVLEVPTGERWSGREGVRAEFERWAAALPDGKQTVHNMIAVDDWVIVEGTLGGTHDGPFVMEDRTIEATGRPFEFRFCTVAKVKDGQEIQTTHYYDLGTIMRQLGVDEAADRRQT
ncbi:MAG: ester cyclase [Actinobacteria bacterium]|nr:ester cyclase [Actinomycetota bacterium]